MRLPREFFPESRRARHEPRRFGFFRRRPWVDRRRHIVPRHERDPIDEAWEEFLVDDPDELASQRMLEVRAQARVPLERLLGLGGVVRFEDAWLDTSRGEQR